MKGDFSRKTFRRDGHYSAVLMQQGRVQLDADWNEQADIASHLDETTRIDVIGRCGMPQDNAGFEVTPAGTDLLLGPGRAYVDGILCENDASPIPAEVKEGAARLDELEADGRPLAVDDWIELSATGVGPFGARITNVEEGDSVIEFEPQLASADAEALHEADDAVVRRVPSFLRQPDYPGIPPSRLGGDPGLYLAYLDVWERHVTALEDPAVREVALGGPDTATRRQTVWQARLERLGGENAEITCATVPDWSTFIDESTALLRARAQPETTSADPCDIPPGAGYRRLENQLYRVEIHDSGNVGSATFKWSRENGSVVVSAQVTDTDELTVSSTGRDEVLGIVAGSWVELTDDTHELGGEPGVLVPVKSIAGNALTVDTTASGALDPAQFPAGPKVRRWDDPNGARTVTIPGGNDGYLALEDGVEVRFEAGRHYVNGDYWLVPARTATGDVEWPQDGGSPAAPVARRPEGIAHHYCKLALLRFDGETWHVLEDCRNLFPPLTDLGGLQRDPGVHVVHIRSGGNDPLQNDTDLLVTDFVKGVEISCDAALEAGTLVNKPTLLFTLDLPFPLNPSDQQFWGRQVVGTVPLTLAGIVRVDGDTIIWVPTGAVSSWLRGEYRKLMVAAKIERSLLHLTLKGNFVYGEGDPSLNVDGETFGKLDGNTLDALLPSGEGRRGGNLDLWFWLRPRAASGTDHVMLVPFAKAATLTTVARRTGLGTMIALGVDRAQLLEALPASFLIDTEARTDPGRARTTMTRLRLATESTVKLAVEETLMPAADEILRQLRANGITLNVAATPVADLVADLPQLADGGFDGVLASEETVNAANEASPRILDLQRARTL